MSITVTDKGYMVAGFGNTYNPKLNSWLDYSGRVRVIESDPSCDLIVKWDRNGLAIDHDFGNVILPSVTSQPMPQASLKGQNIFTNLLRV